MADESNDTKASPAPAPAPATGGGTPPASGGGGSPKHDAAAAKSDAAGKPQQPPAGDAPAAKTIEVGEDEYEVDDKGYVRIPATAFKKRLNRYTKAQLREAFGTDDLEDLKLRIDEHGKLKAQSEEQRRKQQAKEEQLAEDLKKAQDAKAKAEARANQLAEEREYREADSEIRDAAQRHIKAGKASKLAVYEFGEYVRDLDDDEAAKLKARDVEAWFKQWAEENPEFAAKEAAKGSNGGDKPKGERKPLSHGAGDAGAAPPSAPGPGGKTAKPGHPNSMTDAEYREFKRSQGLA